MSYKGFKLFPGARQPGDRRCLSMSPESSLRCVYETGHGGTHRSMYMHRDKRRGYYIWGERIDGVQWFESADQAGDLGPTAKKK